MSIGFRRSAAGMAGLSLLVSLAFADWQQLISGTPALLMSVHFPEGTQVGYVVGSDAVGGGIILKTTDRGETWVAESSGTAVGLDGVYFKNNNNGFAVGRIGTAIRTTDGGATWSPFAVPVTDDLTGVQFPENDQVGYIFTHPRSGPPSKALKTTDGGTNWTAISVGGPASVTRGGNFANDSVGVIVGDDGLVLGTTDGLSSTSYQGAQTNADLFAVALSAASPNKGYLIGNDSTDGVIRYTDDGGATLWDSVRCYSTRAFYGVAMPDSFFGFVCGSGGNILLSASPTDFWRSVTGVAADLHGLSFPNGPDTSYAVGTGGTILRSYDARHLPPHWVTEGKGPAMSRTGIRVVSNPSRHGITFDADRAASVLVLDAAGRVVARRAAAKGLNFLPMSKTGVYLVRVTTEGFTFTQKLVVER
jgi:photosystem II stability/assembly factor-like uncharacterized protein